MSDNFHDLAEENAALAKHLSGQAEAIGYVCIPHAQLEALMVAVKTLPWSRSMLEAMMVQMHSWDNEPTVNVRGQMQRIDKVLTALRAAGIDLSEDKT